MFDVVVDILIVILRNKKMKERKAKGKRLLLGATPPVHASAGGAVDTHVMYQAILPRGLCNHCVARHSPTPLSLIRFFLMCSFLRWARNASKHVRKHDLRFPKQEDEAEFVADEAGSCANGKTHCVKRGVKKACMAV